MFDFGIGELVVIFVVALVVVGPKKLPEVARTIGKGIADIKKSFDDVKGQVQTEFKEIKDTSGIKEALEGGAELKKSFQGITEQVKTDFKEAMDVSITEPPVNETAEKIVEVMEEKGKTDKVLP
jgi:Tat protein translocase TatB subunit